MEEKSNYPNIENSSPSACISAKILSCNRIIANIFRKHLKESNITASQLSILFIVTKEENVNQKKLSDFLYSEKSTINRNIKRLLESNYISYKNNRVLITTEKGKSFLESVIPQWDKAMKEVRQILEKEGEDALNIIQSKLTK